MIPNKKQKTVKIVGGGEKYQAKTVDNISFITSLVINIYTNSERAILRELVSNAIDEHVKYKINKPIDLIIPTNKKNKFLIRDYARGLSHKEVLELFPTIGKSTKQDTNEMIGSFGIGRMSLYTRTDIATLTSYFNNEKLVYCWNRTKEGGIELSLQQRTPTEEPSGLKIEFADKHDKYNYTNELDVLSYFKLPINCNEKIPKPPKTIIDGSCWKIQENKYASSIMIMGGVPYPLQYKFNIKTTFIVECPIGSLDLTNNRDSLRYSTKTNKKLDEINSIINNELENT